MALNEATVNKAYPVPCDLPLKGFKNGDQIIIRGYVNNVAETFTILLKGEEQVALKILVDFEPPRVRITGKGGVEQHYESFVDRGGHFMMTITAAGDQFKITADGDPMTFPYIAKDAPKITTLKICGDLKSPVNVRVIQ